MRRIFGALTLVAGLWLVVYPFVSVRSVTGEALEQLPNVEADQIETDRNHTAMFSDGFVLATRTYSGVSSEQLGDALSSAGFEAAAIQSTQGWTKECCGDFDAMTVTLQESNDEQTVATISVYDGDVQATWPILSGLGLMIAIVGFVITRASVGPQKPDTAKPGEPLPA